jgi:alpha-amylase
MTDVVLELRRTFQRLEPTRGQAPEQAAEMLRSWIEEHPDVATAAKPPAEFNGTMMQWFHWYSPGDGSHWRTLIEEAPRLAAAGITALWLPPAFKGLSGVFDVGYGVYDLYDLGEFDQKGTIRTKYGTRDEYLGAVKTCRDLGINIYADVVFNHRMGADETEFLLATPMDPSDRCRALEGQQKIQAWTKFTFPGRGATHSDFSWNWRHFDGVDFNALRPDFKAIWVLEGKSFEDKVSLESGNFDYLMGCDVDIDDPEVEAELKRWGEWTLDHVGVDGFRLDAIKHIQGDFFVTWIEHLEAYAQRDLFCVGEYWSYDINVLAWYAGNSAGKLNLFDAPLHDNFHRASRAGGHYDMSRILDGTLMQQMPLLAVTLVENHDTQPLQALESVVEPWFKPLAYAIILLRAEGYPCIFHADYYGARYTDRGRDGSLVEVEMASHRWILDRLLFARVHFAHGPQHSYLDHFNAIGWTRIGSHDHPWALAVLLSDGPAGAKWMNAGTPHTRFLDITGHLSEAITTNADGWAEFHCPGGSLSVWVEENPLLQQLPG